MNEQVQPSEEFYRSLVDTLPMNIVRKDLEGRITFANSRFCQSMGLTFDRAIGSSDFDLYPAELARKYRMDDARVIETGEPIEAIEAHETAAGRTFIQIVKTPIRDSTGAVSGVQVIFWDGTERHGVEEQLHFERELLGAMLDTCPDAIFFKDGQSRFLKVSRSLSERLGFEDPARAIGRTDADFFGADHARAAFEDERRIMGGGEPVIWKTEYETFLDGRTRWVTTTKLPLRNREGRIVGTFGLSRDITDLKLAELAVEARAAELQSSLERYRMLVESTNALPWEIDASTNALSYVSPQVVRLLGRDPASLIGTSLLDFVHEEDRVRVKDGLCALVTSASAGNLDLDCRLATADRGTIFARSVISLHRGASGEADVIRGVTIDVTDQKKMEISLHQAQKLESVGRLAAGVAHEINTPVQFVSDSVHFVRDAMADLAVLVGKYQSLHRAVLEGGPALERAAEIAQAEAEADLDYILEQVPRALARSLEGTERVATIVRSLKEFAHPDQKEMMAVDLNQGIRSTLAIARNEYKYVADVETDLGDLPLVTCHGGDINQGILNIIVNAAHAISDVVKGTERRGRITVRTRQQNDTVVIAIGDTGGGIPESIQGRIFDPFFTTKEVGLGTGQGLAITRSLIVEGHGGELTFDTEAGLGTTFFLRLPINPAHRAGAAA